MKKIILFILILTIVGCNNNQKESYSKFILDNYSGVWYSVMKEQLENELEDKLEARFISISKDSITEGLVYLKKTSEGLYLDFSSKKTNIFFGKRIGMMNDERPYQHNEEYNLESLMYRFILNEPDTIFRGLDRLFSPEYHYNEISISIDFNSRRTDTLFVDNVKQMFMTQNENDEYPKIKGFRNFYNSEELWSPYFRLSNN